jgi:hypothetical protein
VLSYDFSGSVLDSAGGNALTGPAPVFTSDRCGAPNGALRFAGADYYRTNGTVAALPRGDSARTLSAWIRCTARGLNTRSIVQFGERVLDQNSALVINDGQVAYYAEATLDVFASAAPGPCSGAFTHVAAVYNSTARRVGVWLNGTLLLQQSVAAFATPASPLRLGFFPNYDGAIFEGDMDSAAVYNVALTPAQLRALAREPCRPQAECPAGTQRASASGQCVPVGAASSSTGSAYGRSRAHAAAELGM